MKKLLLLLAVTMAVLSVSAQDIIVKKNGEEIRAKVEEVGEQSIRYRKFSNLTGPIYSIARSEVFVIRYESGAKDVITPLDAPQQVAASAAPALPTRKTLERAVVAAKKAERKKMTEFGVRAEAGLSFWSFKKDFEDRLTTYKKYTTFSNQPQLQFAVSANVDHYFKKAGEGYIGGGLGFMHDASGLEILVAMNGESGTMDFRTKYDAVFANVYYGMRPVRGGFHMRVGFRLAYLMGMKLKMDCSGDFDQYWEEMADGLERNQWLKIDNSLVRSFNVYPYLDLGYAFKHVDLGVQWLYAFVAPHKEMGNRSWSLAVTCNYRF